MIMEQTNQDFSAEARAALSKAAEWRMLSLLLERPHWGWYEEVEALGREVDEPALRETVALSRQATEEAYLTLIGPGGLVSPREVAYAGFEDPGRLLADVMAFYHAFAYSPHTEDPVDHIAVQTGFIGYLALKDAYAQACGNSDAIEATRSSIDHFLEAHFARLVRGFAEKLDCTGPDYLNKTVEALQKRVRHVPAAKTLSVPAVDPMASGCPMAGEDLEPEELL